MTRQLISSGSAFEKEMAYSRAVVQGDWIFVAGTTGYNYETMRIAEDIVTQAVQCFENIRLALQKAGAELADVVQVRYYLTRAEDVAACGPIMQQYFGEIRPAASMLIVGLIDPKMKIEIEVTALRP
ncbi:MAG: RidA family protein [Microscillaceae bacterium]|nr:RidA family protein [Microscillaceae bacterium]